MNRRLAATLVALAVAASACVGGRAPSDARAGDPGGADPGVADVADFGEPGDAVADLPDGRDAPGPDAADDDDARDVPGDGAADLVPEDGLAPADGQAPDGEDPGPGDPGVDDAGAQDPGADDPGPCPWDVCDCRTAADCGTGRFCDGGTCRDWVCTPGQRLCVGDLLVRCAADGGSATTLQRCDDFDPCTVGDGCVDRACAVPVPVDCDDGNPCTDDRCDGVLGCVNTPRDVACDDGNPCTALDACVAGTCRGTMPLPCDDGNPCTEDLCAPVVGCVHRPRAAHCDDANPCTEADACVEGRCAGAPIACDDGDPCTADACAAATGACTHARIPGCGPCDDDADCVDDDPCSLDRCAAGTCAHAPAPGCCGADADCEDGDPCTVGTCAGAPFGRCVQSGAPIDGCCAPVPFVATFEDGLDGFEPLPADAEIGWRLAVAPGGGTTALYYGNADASGFDDGAPNAGDALGPATTLPAGVAMDLVFRVWMDVESIAGSDVFRIEALTDGGAYVPWERPAGFPMRAWQTVAIPIDALAGRTVRWMLRFDTIDALANDGRGVFVDDLRVEGACVPRTCARPADCASLGRVAACDAGTCDAARVLQALATWTGGPLAADTLASPGDVAIEADGGRVFVTDKSRHQVLVFDADGALWTRFGGYGTGPGQFSQPRGVAAGDGRVLVADTGNHRVQAFTPSGVPLWSLGDRGAEPGRFDQPKDVALSPDGDTLYVADTGNHRVQAFSRNGVFRFAFGGYGQKAGQFRAPSCVTVAPDGEVLVCDTGNNRIQAFSPGGRWRATLVPGDGSGLNQPYGVAALPDGVRVVVDSYRHGLAWLQADGTVLARFGGFGDADGRFAYPLGIAHDGARDRLFVADANNARLVVVGWAPLP